ncbi:MAG: BadF/BadG/BcrA/BcrD ATPase family protein [Bacillota bacterium]
MIRADGIMEVTGLVVGVPKEIKYNENRVAIAPSGGMAFADRGRTVLVEKSAGPVQRLTLMKGYYLGFDGGQSGSRLLLADAEGHVVVRAEGPPFEHLKAADGERKIRAAFETCLEPVIAGRYPVRSAFLGLTGLSDPEAPEAGPILGMFNSILEVEQVGLDNDSVSCWAGASGCKPGVMVAAGTGVVAYGVGPGGKSVKVGGWGYIMGDLGGAFDIGRRALIAVAKESDKRLPQSILTRKVLNHFGARRLREIQRRLYRLEEERLTISSLASVVAGAAEEGDRNAASILCESGHELAELALTAIQRLGWESSEPLRVACVGGVFRAGSLVKDSFRDTLVREVGGVLLVEPLLDPVAGAVLLAWRQAGIEVTSERVQALRSGLQDGCREDGCPDDSAGEG